MVSTFLAVRLLTIAAPSIRARGGSFLDRAFSTLDEPNARDRTAREFVCAISPEVWRISGPACANVAFDPGERVVMFLTQSWRNLHAIMMLALTLQN